MDSTHSQNKNEKWQNMLAIVNQHTAIVQPNFSQQFKKIVIIRFLTENILTFLFQYIGLMLMDGLSPQALAPVWFSSGSASAFIFMRGLSVIPGILFGSFYAYYLSTHNVFLASMNAGLDISQGFLLLTLSYKFISPTLIFSNLIKFYKFIFITILLTAICSLHIELFYFSNFHQAFELWLRWFLGNLNGVLIFSLTILTWDLYFLEKHQLKKFNKSKLILYYGALVLDVILLLSSSSFFYILLFSLMSFAIIMFISLRLGWCGLIAAMFLFGLMLNFSVYVNAPILSQSYLLPAFTYIQFLLIAETIIGLSTVILKGKRNETFIKHI